MTRIAWSVFCCLWLSPIASARVLLYPTAVRTLPNVYAGKTWSLADPAFRARHADGVTFAKGTGGPFAPSNATYAVTSTKPQPGYWHAYIQAKPGRTYLAGTWAKFGNAKIILSYDGRFADTGRPVSERLYYMSGFNPELKPYFNEALLKRLGGDPTRWRCLYRTLTFPTALTRDYLHVEQGLYLAAGDVVFSEPFFVDVTDGPHTLEIDIADAKPIRRLAVANVDLRDVRWERSFDPPVTAFKTTLPPEIDAFRGQENDRPKGHILTVTYADGSGETVTAPLDNVSKTR